MSEAPGGLPEAILGAWGPARRPSWAPGFWAARKPKTMILQTVPTTTLVLRRRRMAPQAPELPRRKAQLRNFCKDYYWPCSTVADLLLQFVGPLRIWAADGLEDLLERVFVNALWRPLGHRGWLWAAASEGFFGGGVCWALPGRSWRLLGGS